MCQSFYPEIFFLGNEFQRDNATICIAKALLSAFLLVVKAIQSEIVLDENAQIITASTINRFNFRTL